MSAAARRPAERRAGTRGRRRWWGLLILLAAAPAGCGGSLPVSGGIHVERTVPVASEPLSQEVREVPGIPSPGEAPAAIVQGFLAAQAGDEDADEAARTFLVPTAPWSPAPPVTIYSASTTTLVPPVTVRATPGKSAGGPSAGGRSADAPSAGGPGAAARSSPTPSVRPDAASTSPAGTKQAVVRVSLTLLATLDRNGVYTPVGGTRVLTYDLDQVDGQWRIATLPNGRVLAIADLQRSYVPVRLWWLTPDLRTLVPDIRWLPAPRGGLATALVRAELAGPRGGLAAGVRTAAPFGTALQGSATFDGAAIRVDLTSQAASLIGAQARGLVAQLQELLTQVPGATDLRITVDGQQFPPAVVPAQIPLRTSSADPDGAATASGAWGVVGGQVAPIYQPGTAPKSQVLRSSRLSAPGLRDPAVNAGATGVAAILGPSMSSSTVLGSSPLGAGRQTVLTGGSWRSLSYALDGTLVAAAPGSLTLVSAAGDISDVPLALPAGSGPITQAVVARDGVRVAVLSGPAGHRSLRLAVLSGPDPRGLPTRAVAGAALTPGLSDVSAVAWATADTLVVLGRTAGGPAALWTVSVDGSGLSGTAVPTPGASTVAAAPGQPTLVGATGGVYEHGSSGWREVGEGVDPTYPG